MPIPSPKPTSESAQRTILDHQRAAFDKLVAIGKACFAIDRRKLTLRPRTNTLIIGPSGSGKTYLARELARELEVPLLHISISEWILSAVHPASHPAGKAKGSGGSRIRRSRVARNYWIGLQYRITRGL